MSSAVRQWLVTMMFTVFAWSASAQGQIPLGAWRYHLSYNSIRSVDVGGSLVYAAPQNGVMIYNRDDQQVETLTKLNGLSATGVVIVRYDITTRQLLVAYENGTFDVIKERVIQNVDPSANTVITGSRKINGITIENGIAYISTDFGVLLFDLNTSKIKETWRDLGPAGSTLAIYQSAFTSDSVFLGTEKGIMVGKRTDNLLDFNKWKRYDTGELNVPVKHLAFFDNAITAAVDDKGLFVYGDGTWTLSTILIGATFRSLRASASALIVSEVSNLWSIDAEENVTPIENELINSVSDAVGDGSGKIWIGDSRNGLVSDWTGSFISVLPDGPSSDSIFNLVYHDDKIHAFQGGFDQSGAPFNNEGEVDIFQGGSWNARTLPARDLTSIAFSSAGIEYVASYGHGVIQNENGSVTIWDESNSTLPNTNPPERSVPVVDVANSGDGLWVATYGSGQPLHRFSEGSWQAYSFPVSQSNYPEKVLVDSYQDVWLILSAMAGGGIFVYDPDVAEYRYLNNQPGKGFLPSAIVYDIEEDRDGYMWVGTSQGVAYFYNYKNDAVRPIFESRYLLASEKVKAIAVDGGNRKWMGTERGAWLFNPTGEELVAHFTSENSPLPSDDVTSIEVNDRTGEVFFGTARGVCSYRSNSTESDFSFADVKIFPNPVYREFSGEVGISGLATDAIVKITDVSGKLVWQTQANGGTASWNVTDAFGRRVNTGIFLVYAVTQDGTESIVGKIAVIN